MTGLRLGPWFLDKEIGRGGMGAVYLARPEPPDADLPDRAAVKVLAAELAADPGFRQRFQREIEILRQLDHPNIVRYLGSGEQNGRFYCAMEFVDGPSFETLRQGRKLPWQEVLDLALQVAPALKHAHDRGIVHRDLKPSNILRAAPGPEGGHPFGRVKLTDFGIATLFSSPHLTLPGGIVGTAEFLSPEQAAGKPATPRSDLYSLGVLLYTLLTGRPPFEGDVVELLHKHRYGQFDRPSRRAVDLPPAFGEVVCQLLEKDPGDRPGDGGALFRKLDSVRRKLERKAALEEADTAEGPALTDVATAAGLEGPATLMSRLMRAELERENRGGPVKQFLNRPLVLVTLFVLTVGAIAWALWPVSAESLYRRGAELMASPDPADWDRGWEEYLLPLKQKYPDNPYGKELADFQRQYEDHQAGREASLAARHAGPMAEAQWFYQKGLRQEQEGDAEGARKTWEALIAAFKDVPSEGPWVRLAEQALTKAAPADRSWDPVRVAVRRARQLRAEGRGAEADAALRALRELYGGDAGAEKVLQEAER